MKTLDKFRFAMAQALDDVEGIECSPKERLDGIDAMQDLLIEAFATTEERAEVDNVIQLSDYRGKLCRDVMR